MTDEGLSRVVERLKRTQANWYSENPGAVETVYIQHWYIQLEQGADGLWGAFAYLKDPRSLGNAELFTECALFAMPHKSKMEALGALLWSTLIPESEVSHA